MKDEAKIGVIGGSGVYEMEKLTDTKLVRISTPFGEPSDDILLGNIGDRRVAFVPRHGRGHRFFPAEVNYRANIYALKQLGVEHLLAFSAVGSMKEEYEPRHIVIPDQLFDRTKDRPSTFFGDGIVVHVGFADPYCPNLSGVMHQTCKDLGITSHLGGTYVCINGPQFSTRAESRIYRQWGVDVIGMTNLQEAKLAREAEICFTCVALVTDYDVWHQGEEDVSVTAVLDNLRANTENVKRMVESVVPRIPLGPRACFCGKALQGAIMTSKDKIPPETRRAVDLLIGKYL